jgi:protein-tyrosine phosphatase
MSERARLLEVEGMRNLRDVGGYRLTSGGRTSWGVLYRGGAPGELTTEGREQLAALGLRTVVDLREPVEQENLPSPDLGGADVHAVSFYRDRIVIDEIEDLQPLYDQMIDHSGADITAVVKLLAADHALPALVHCSAGKDRTGLLIGLLLSALGVPDDLVAEDYGRTADTFTGEYRERMLARGVKVGIDAQRVALLSGSPPELMIAVLERVKRSYGDARGYLRAHGCTAAELLALQERLTRAD